MELAKTIALSAAGGLVVGLVGCGGGAKAADQPSGESTAAPADTAMPEAGDSGAKNCCKGQNECAKKGNCKVEGTNECKGQNECKNKGGCKPADCK
jgi:hypothetical protein